MVGDSSNLVDLIRSHLTGGLGNRISGLLGEDRSKTQSGMDAAVPGILSSLESTASTTDGSQRLSNAADGADDTMLSKISEMFGTAPSSEDGVGTLRSILGAGGFSELAGNIGRTSGLSGKGSTALLGFLAPVVLGVLKSVKRAKGLDAAGLSSLLSSQKANFAAAVPEGSPAGTRVESTSPREPLRDVSSRASQGEPVRAEETYTHGAGAGRSSGSWTVPILVLLGLLGLLWYWGSRPSVHAGREQQAVTDQARPGTSMTLDTLKSKYRPAIEMVYTLGGQITTLDQQDGKLVIKGTAPSLEAANRIWDQIKNINPNMDDISADFRVVEHSGTSNP